MYVVGHQLSPGTTLGAVIAVQAVMRLLIIPYYRLRLRPGTYFPKGSSNQKACYIAPRGDWWRKLALSLRDKTSHVLGQVLIKVSAKY